MNPVWWRRLSLRLNWSRKEVKSSQPYKMLAPIYDHIMRHVDYQQWADYVCKLIQEWKPQTTSVLDIACGTGNLVSEIQRISSFQLYGCDYSVNMIEQAKNKSQLSSIPLWQCDMKFLPLKKKFDVILCLYDSINYFMKEDDIRKFFSEVSQVLSPGGLVIFDICTEKNSIEFFYNFYDHDSQENFSYDRWSHYDSKSNIQYTEFKIRYKSDPVTYLEIHKQRIYSTLIIYQIIEASTLELLARYDGFSMNPPTANTKRIHYVLQQKDG